MLKRLISFSFLAVLLCSCKGADHNPNAPVPQQPSPTPTPDTRTEEEIEVDEFLALFDANYDVSANDPKVTALNEWVHPLMRDMRAHLNPAWNSGNYCVPVDATLPDGHTYHWYSRGNCPALSSLNLNFLKSGYYRVSIWYDLHHLSPIQTGLGYGIGIVDCRKRINKWIDARYSIATSESSPLDQTTITDYCE